MQRTTILICIAAAGAAAIYGMWVLLGWYISPETPTDRKDHVQVMAVGLGAVGAIVTAIIGWRNLKQSRSSTETTIENTRLIEEDRAQNDALQKYLEQMGQLLTKEKLRTSEKDADVRVLARSQTLTVLQGLSSPDRKRILLGFLYESHLITRDDSIVSLVAANLIEADLSWAGLYGTNLSGAQLRGADLSGAQLIEADLSRSNLYRADLSGAQLRGAYLSGAYLNEADLSRTNLNEADLSRTNLNEANLFEANLSGAYLSGADLQTARSLTQTQIEKARGDEYTKLPYVLQRPDSWTKNT